MFKVPCYRDNLSSPGPWSSCGPWTARQSQKPCWSGSKTLRRKQDFTKGQAVPSRERMAAAIPTDKGEGAGASGSHRRAREIAS